MYVGVAKKSYWALGGLAFLCLLFVCFAMGPRCVIRPVLIIREMMTDATRSCRESLQKDSEIKAKIIINVYKHVRFFHSLLAKTQFAWCDSKNLWYSISSVVIKIKVLPTVPLFKPFAVYQRSYHEFV
jgi:hypothetical protein